MKIIDWLADKVQATTGEKERRQKVERIKELVSDFKINISHAINVLNESIEKFNYWIRNLNDVRKQKIGINIRELNSSLTKYGNCKVVEEYADEYEKNNSLFPEETYQKLEDYLGDIDWSSDDVFWSTFLLSPLGMKHKTRKQNVQLTESANDLELLIAETLKELEIKKFNTELETSICQMYIENVLFISNTISNVIIPELRIIDSFFQAEKLKNVVICNKELNDIVFEYNISSLVDTKYERHYQFIKNAFAFYVIACKIYNTPVLSRLLQHNVTETDRSIVNKENELLSLQAGKVRDLVCFG